MDSVPVTLVIDPVTGQKMRLWRGMIQPENLLEVWNTVVEIHSIRYFKRLTFECKIWLIGKDLLQFMDGSPKDHHFSLSHKRPRENSQAPPPKIQAMPGLLLCFIVI